jgi:hypothetical protein
MSRLSEIKVDALNNILDAFFDTRRHAKYITIIINYDSQQERLKRTHFWWRYGITIFEVVGQCYVRLSDFYVTFHITIIID